MILKALIVAINHVRVNAKQNTTNRFYNLINRRQQLNSFVFDWIILILNWSGRRESNPHTQLGKLVFYH